MIITSEMNPVAAKATFKPSAIFDEVVVFIRYVFSINCTLEKDSSQEGLYQIQDFGNWGNYRAFALSL